MDKFYQVTDLDAGRVVSEHPSLADAFENLQSIVNQYGDEAVTGFALTEHADGKIAVLAMDGDLIRQIRDRKFARVIGIPEMRTSVSGTATTVIHTTSSASRSAISWFGSLQRVSQVSNVITTAGHSH